MSYWTTKDQIKHYLKAWEDYSEGTTKERDNQDVFQNSPGNTVAVGYSQLCDMMKIIEELKDTQKTIDEKVNSAISEAINKLKDMKIV